MIRIGISGWRYEPWRGVWYSEGLPHRRELEFCGRHFATVEINGSFYSLQRPEYYDDWYRETPPGFLFAVKGSRYITHLLRLRNIERPLANFFASGIFNLRDKLGPFLWQFPPQMSYDRERFDAFFSLLPRNTKDALALARRRDARMTGRSRLAIDENRELRHAVEIRHPSFMHADFVALLRKHGIGLVVADTAGKWPKLFHVTSDFVYVRLHGDVKIYTSGYTDRALASWARRIRNWDRDGRDVYVYFDNDVKVRAPFDALTLMGKLGLAWGTPVYAPGTRVPRLKYAYGPRVTGGNPAWDDLRPSGTRKAGTRSPRSTAAYAPTVKGGSASAGAGRR
ncbi:MAG TPA: DUF72 domain-containing protein [Burkholderiales bacterium]|nr:DUF72 domain-containing protein [Burkholderiales bacterium]